MSRRTISIILVLAAIVVFALAAQGATVAAAPPHQGPTGDPQRGAYIFAAAAGCGCHITDKGFLAGGAEFDLGPLGKVYSRNITSDPETGIGNWTEDQIVAAIRTGVDDEGKQLFPVMPYKTFTGMSDQDAHDLAAFIKTAPAIKNVVPENQLNIPVPPFTPASPPATAPTEGVARGAYLVTSVSDCGGCHTPTDDQGNPIAGKLLAGSFIEGEVSANITPDNDTGIGKWTEAQIAELLKTGKRPDGTSVAGLMAQVVQGGFSKLTDADRAAIAAYLKTIPAVNNVPKAPAPLPSTGMNLNDYASLAVLVVGSVLLLGGAFAMRRSFRRVK